MGSIAKRVVGIAVVGTLLLILGPALAAADTCPYFAEDFSGTSGHDWAPEFDMGTWQYQSGSLRISGIAQDDKVAAAGTSFFPGGMFFVDVDVAVDNFSADADAVGIYAFTSADVLFSASNMTIDGVAVFVYPKTQEMKFWLWDIESGWNSSNAFPLEAPVSSIGMKFIDSGVIFRLNGKDSTLRLEGDFSLADVVIDKLWLMAKGSGLQARFDNVCAGPLVSAATPPPPPPAAQTMPLPGGANIYPYPPVATAVASTTPGSARPLGFGSAASQGPKLSLQVLLPASAGPMDLYLVLSLDTALPGELFFFTPQGGLTPLSQAGSLVKWKPNLSQGVDERIWGDIPTSQLPPGSYTFYLLATPANSLNAFYLWYASLQIPQGGGGTVPGSDMEADIRRNLDFLLGLIPAQTGGLSEITAVMGTNGAYATMTPAKLSFPLPPKITYALNFGSGYRAQNGTLISGSGNLIVTNPVFGSNGMSADFSLTANNITLDGVTLVDGSLDGSLSLGGTNDSVQISGWLEFHNLLVGGKTISGRIDLSAADLNLDLSNPNVPTQGGLTLTLSNLTVGEYTVSSGTVKIGAGAQGQVTVAADLNTNQGPVDMDLRISQQGKSYVISTAQTGKLGPYGLTISGLTFDAAVCSSYPSGGTATFTQNGRQGVVAFSRSCDGTYTYTETP